MLTLKQFEQYNLNRYLKEARESNWNGVARFLHTLHLWEESKKNINEYWFGIPSVPNMKIIWKLPHLFFL